MECTARSVTWSRGWRLSGAVSYAGQPRGIGDLETLRGDMCNDNGRSLYLLFCFSICGIDVNVDLQISTSCTSPSLVHLHILYISTSPNLQVSTSPSDDRPFDSTSAYYTNPALAPPPPSSSSSVLLSYNQSLLSVLSDMATSRFGFKLNGGMGKGGVGVGGVGVGGVGVGGVGVVRLMAAAAG